MVNFGIQTRCLACSSNVLTGLRNVSDTRFGIKGEYEIGRCLVCDIEQTVPAPTPLEIKELYEKHYNFGGEKDTAYTRFREWFLSSTIYHFWLGLDGDISFHRRRGAGLLLDVGCNEGRGLNIYRKNGFDPEGLELNEVAAREARDRGFTVYTELLEKFQPDQLYDIVVLSNVIEHSLDPKIMLNHVNRILKTGGKVWISCPNVDSWQRKVFGKYWINWHVPFHIFHFSKNTLAKILKGSGFKIIKEKPQSPSLWLAQSIIARLFSKPNKQTKYLRKTSLVATLMIFIRFLLFSFLWIGNFLNKGDCLVVIAKKV